MSVLYSKACPRSHRSRALALWLPQRRGSRPSNIPHTTRSARFKNHTVQYGTFIRLYWYISREFRTRFARLMPCTIPSDSPAINFVSKRPWQTFLQTAIIRCVGRSETFSSRQASWIRQKLYDEVRSASARCHTAILAASSIRRLIVGSSSVAH